MSITLTQTGKPKGCKLKITNIIRNRLSSLLDDAGYDGTSWNYRIESRVKFRGGDRSYGISPPTRNSVPVIVRAKGNSECWKVELVPNQGAFDVDQVYTTLRHSIGGDDNSDSVDVPAETNPDPVMTPPDDKSASEVVKTKSSRKGMLDDPDLVDALIGVLADHIIDNQVQSLGRSYYAQVLRKELKLESGQNVAGPTRKLLSAGYIVPQGSGTQRVYMLTQKAWDTTHYEPPAGTVFDRDDATETVVALLEPSTDDQEQDAETVVVPSNLADQVADRIAKMQHYQAIVEGATDEGRIVKNVSNEIASLRASAARSRDEHNRLLKRLKELEKDAEEFDRAAEKKELDFKEIKQKHSKKVNDAKLKLSKMLGV